MRHARLLAAIAIAWPAAAPAQGVEELRRLDDMDRKCLQAREARLAGVRRQKIEECVKPASPKDVARPRAECEAFWSDYGMGDKQRLYMDLPECQAAFEARQQYRAK